MKITDIETARAEFDALINVHGPLTVLTGAGLSTASGIPDYRDAQGNWKSAPPIQHQDFMRSEAMRKRYWARSMHGWPVLYHAQPNAGHHYLAQLQRQGKIGTIITQNVDGLHQRAGATDVVNLHGYANDMICMSCGARSPRLEMHERCLALNPHFAALSTAIDNAVPLPDGDAAIDANFDDFEVANCTLCDGILKPDVVYFGDNVPRERVESAQRALSNSGGLLVIGSSLMVFSGYRFAQQAHAAEQPIALLTRGKTRADDIATLKLDVPIEAVLSA